MSTTAASRPLRALALVLGAWVAGRTAVLFAPTAAMVEPPVRPIAVTSAEPALVAVDPQTLTGPAVSFSRIVLPSLPNPVALPRARSNAVAAPVVRRPVAPPPAVLRLSPVLPAIVPAPVEATASTAPPPAVSPTASRPGFVLSGSAWLFARERGPTSLGQGQLGGSQAGVRLYGRFARTPLALTARVSAPLRDRGAEASGGVALVKGNTALLLERRVAVDKGGRDAFSATAVTGASDRPLPLGLTAEYYAQAGVVGLRQRDLFIDGAVSARRRLRDGVEAGLGVSGGAQPGVRRLDLGPQLVWRNGRVRVTGEYRVRVAGNAVPASGPALTLATDF